MEQQTPTLPPPHQIKAEAAQKPTCAILPSLICVNYGILKGQRKIPTQTHQCRAKIYHSSRFDSKKMFFRDIRKRFFFQILAAQAYV